MSKIKKLFDLYRALFAKIYNIFAINNVLLTNNGNL